jgi:hypothetical protein
VSYGIVMVCGVRERPYRRRLNSGNSLATVFRKLKHIGATMSTMETESIRHPAKIAALPFVENRATAESA